MSDQFWFLAVIGLSVAILLIGHISARKLSPENKKIRIRRYAGLGLGIMCFSLPWFQPFVGIGNWALQRDKLSASRSSATTPEHDRLQNDVIEDLREEVISLRTDLKDTTRYYSNIVLFLSTLLGFSFLTLFWGGSTPLLGEAPKETPGPEKYDIFNRN